ncbi:MAG: hypothetical protein GX895_07630 [Clostridiales bacterium]|nr:hypothetical protein [Clostridiales bacterium]
MGDAMDETNSTAINRFILAQPVLYLHHPISTFWDVNVKENDLCLRLSRSSKDAGFRAGDYRSQPSLHIGEQHTFTDLAVDTQEEPARYTQRNRMPHYVVADNAAIITIDD